MFVVAVCWAAMRPYVGIPLLIVCCIIFGGLGAYKYQAKKKREAKVGDSEGLKDSADGGDGGDAAVIGNTEAPTEAPYCGPVPEDVAKAFLESVKQEYDQGQEGKVGDFFGANGDSEGVLGPFEERVRGAGDKGQEIQKIAMEWNLKL